jgi:hypothetical protein
MRPTLGLAPLLLILLLSFGVATARAESALQPTRPEITERDIDDALGSDWYGVYFRGAKVGWARIETTKPLVGGTMIVRESLVMEIKGAPADSRFSQTLEYDLTPPYRLRAGEFADAGGGVRNVKAVRAAGTGYEAVIVSGNAERKRPLPGWDYTFADALSMDIWLRRRAPRPGEAIAWRTIDSESLQVKLETGSLIGTKNSIVGGVGVAFHEVKVLSHNKQEMLLGYDAARRRVIFASLGSSEFELRLETEAQAKDATYAADPFVLGMVKLDRPIGNPERIVALVLEARGPDLGKHIAPGPHQHVEINADGSVVIKLGAKYAAPVPATEAEASEALRETLRYPIDEPRVKALALEAIGDAGTPREMVARLLRFTSRYIRPQVDAVGPQLLDLLDRRAGDCKSYALLFNTLARAVGVPAREVAGLGYMGDDVMAFGGHVWNEVVLDGFWVPVDAQTPHVPMREVHVRGGLADEFTTLPRTSLRVLAVETVP